MVIRDSERNLFFVLVLIVIIHVAMYNTHPMATLVRAASGSPSNFAPFLFFHCYFLALLLKNILPLAEIFLTALEKKGQVLDKEQQTLI